MRHKTQKHQIDGLIALVLFGVFAACILSVLLTGANAYSRLTKRDQGTFASRTCIQYVATKVRQIKSGGDVAVEDFGGRSALCLYEKIGERRFVTRIYSYDGWLREIFTSASTESKPSDGEKILSSDDIDFKLDGGLLTVSLSDADGNVTSLSLSLRGEGDAEQ